MSPQIIIVMEDDPFQSERIVRDLKDAFPVMELRDCATEREFRECVDKLVAGQLACVVLDAMVPWDFPSENMPVPPEEVQTGDMFGAGRRCLEYVRWKLGKNIPVCIHTILDREDANIDEDDDLTVFIAKKPNGDLVGAVDRLLRSSRKIAE